jgi:muramoyltetrapeptide carboxypeptidase
MKPASLQPGDKIGVMAPSGYVEKADMLAAKEFLQAKGFSVFLHPQYESRFNQSAGTSEEKAAALHDLFADTTVKAIFAAGGGNRALHLLEKLDYDLIAANPKIFMGFSDVTALLNTFYSKAGLVTFHGPVLNRIVSLDDEQFSFALDLLAGRDVEYPVEQCRILKEGTAEGALVGGNLSLFHLLPNTDFAPACDGAILFLEDWREEMSKIDRMFLQLRRTGVFSEISGLVCGNFGEPGDSGRPYGFTLDEIILEHAEGYGFPIVLDAPFGHGDKLYPFPVGGKARLSATDGLVSLSLPEPAVRI